MLSFTYTPEKSVSALPPTYALAASSLLLMSGSDAIIDVTNKSNTPVAGCPVGDGHAEPLRLPWKTVAPKSRPLGSFTTVLPKNILPGTDRHLSKSFESKADISEDVAANLST